MLALPDAEVDIAIADRAVEMCELRTIEAKATALEKQQRKLELLTAAQEQKITEATRRVHEKRGELGTAWEQCHDRIRAKGGQGAEYNPKVELSSDFDIPSDVESEEDDNDNDNDNDIPNYQPPPYAAQPAGHRHPF